MPRSLHPQGTFEAVVTDHGFGTSQSGTDQFVVRFETQIGELGSDEITGYFSMSDRAIEHTLKKIRAMNYQGVDLADLADGTALRGNVCQITVDHEEYEGVTRAKVGWVNPPDYSPGIRRDDTAAANARKFNALLKKTPVVEVPAKPTAAAEPDRFEEDGSIPF